MLIADSWVIGTRPVLVVGKDLEFLAKIDFAHVHTLRHPEHGRGEVEDTGHAGVDEPIGALPVRRRPGWQ